MTLRDDEPRERGVAERPCCISERVAQLYYTFGLIACSYPISILSVAITVAVACCYPLYHLPLPGNAPFRIRTNNLTSGDGNNPFCYVQQVVLRSAVFPWEPHLTLGDGFRAPLYESFKLLDIVRNYEGVSSSRTLGNICLHVEAIKRVKAVYEDVLPQYSCLVLSPANFWQQDAQQFAQDNFIFTTIFNHQNYQKGKTSIAEMLFGMQLIDTGMKRYPFRNRQRIIQYAVTLFFKDYDEPFVEGLRQKLYSLYPLHQNESYTKTDVANETVLIQYPGEINYFELAPITMAFLFSFLYCYFSVRKIELIHSKFGMAFAVVVMVAGSLTMTLGICSFFGLQLSLQGKQVFPYLSMLVGIENVLVLTKSVVSTSTRLDVKIRIAQGLSKEGWSITKNLLLEITILTFGLFTFVPAIQEFCLFCIVGLMTDVFLQMFFFSAVLCIDITRTENLNEKSNSNFRGSLYQNRIMYDRSSNTNIIRSKSHPRLTSYGTNVVGGQFQGAQEKKIPKRLRLVNIWARTRFFQRSFMILMATWIFMIAYNSGLIEHYILNRTLTTEDNSVEQTNISNRERIRLIPLLSTKKPFNMNYFTHNPLDNDYIRNQTENVDKLKHLDFEPWRKLSFTHWFSILNKYNISVSGQYIAILPSIKLSHVISPDEAVSLNNPNEKYGESFNWHALAAALDPFEYAQQVTPGKLAVPQSEQPLYPSTPMEMFFTIVLCLISVIVLAYGFVVLYRFVCSRNYPEWRASWFNEKTEESSGEDPMFLEMVQTVLEGHQQEIECLVTDGVNMVSSCLGGVLKVWDNSTGELLSCIDRYSYFSSDRQELIVDVEDNAFSDYESGSPPSRDEYTHSFPRLLHKINTDFSNIKTSDGKSLQSPTKYNFTDSYRQLYLSHEVGPTIRNRIKDMNWLKDIVRSDSRQSFSETYSNKRSVSENGKSKSYDSSGDGKRASFNRELSDSSNNSGKVSPVWCIDYLNNLIVIGCADGRLEFWEATRAQLKCFFDGGTEAGVTSIKIVGSKVIAARYYGTIDLFMLQTYNHGRPIDWNFTCAYRRTHIRTGSTGSLSDQQQIIKECDNNDEMKCVKMCSVKAHQQPISCLECEGGRILSGSQDHTLKVFKLEDGKALYTLHGHCGPITSMFIDTLNPATAGSGSQDGMLCVWDLLTGTCMYSIQAHDGSVVSLTYSPSYVISLGSDDRLCVWERFQGHHLKSIHISQPFSSHVLMLGPNLVVTAHSGGLVIWDVRSGECVRAICLGRSPYVFIKQLVLLRDAVLCDYGNQLRIVRFPLITHKFD